ncbi:ABC transporter ATP-binding protein [Sphingomonas sp.]|uniref:ABC transporter ATP-binding protein n=1 Tax=Sphingomonas sp. TaxID=28214 RepID=UPI0025F11CB7|nr:ABC transporter ATP-binding protein [Sphingomonas sp.]
MSVLVEHLVYTHRGGVKALDNVSIAFRAGRVTAVIGPNGSGKTTLLRIVSGVLVPDSGTVSIDGVKLSTLSASARARRIGYLPQTAEGVWNVTARELVALGRLPHRSRFAGPDARDTAAIAAALVATDTEALADRPLDAMSGGERARVLLARVIAGEPEWLLADEPLANLDPRHQQRMLTLMAQTAAAGCGVVTVLHDLNAAAAADDIVMLRNGRIVAAGPTVEAFTAEALAETFDMSFTLLQGPHGRTVITRAA